MSKFTRVLLVDDDDTTNFLNELLLSSLAVADEVVVARNGAEALATLNGLGPVAGSLLILLDVNMPVMNGLEFLEAYQRLPIFQQQAPAIVMLTTTLHPRDLEHLQQLPINGLLSKPLTEEKVKSLLPSKK